MMKLHQMAPAPFCLFFLIKICSFLLYPSLQIPPVKKKNPNKQKNTGDKWVAEKKESKLSQRSGAH